MSGLFSSEHERREIASNVNIDLGIDFGKLTELKALEGLTFGNAWSWRFGDNLSRDKIGNNFTVQQVYGDVVMRCQAMYFGYHKNINDDWNEADELELAEGGEEGASDGAERYEHFSITVDKGQSMMRLDKYLTTHIENCSRNRIQNAIDDGGVFVNEKPQKASYKVKPFDILSCRT